MRPHAWKSSALLALAAVSLLPGGCVLAPHGAKEEAASLELAGKPYEKPFEERELPELPAEPTSDDVLRRALLASGEVEAAYYEWAAAVHRIRQAGGYPNTPLTVSPSYMFSGGSMKAFDRTTVNIGP